ncbi:E3 ubiquitin-protein ligase PRT1 [Acorus calamus]|uniref:E3 ubiquitin-protein ligase PRT1 n=1 Tax=Acorus calamus TaxID=4465 RepID=A0AAV9E4D6_ACOCL|nr:E3 ubiquitin-protein ligase PRT1 [Acorus calamus]
MEEKTAKEPPTKVEDQTLDSMDDTGDDEIDKAFQCFICLDLFYKPVVLACGHVSCFWCAHMSMSGWVQHSHCPICRQTYNHFPSICELLHLLLLKTHPVVYKRREKQVLEEEKKNECFSPQLVDGLMTKTEHGLAENALENGTSEQISITDVLCTACKKMLFRPAVLNCGHVYCEDCVHTLVNGVLRCQVCQSCHPGGFPKVCLVLDNFLEEHFPEEYAQRKDAVQLRQQHARHAGPSTCESQNEKGSTKSARKDGLLRTNGIVTEFAAHIGVGCDSCGVFPMMGKRYKCKDCMESIGFDLCGDCYESRSKLPGRFNQQHTPDHRSWHEHGED